MEEDFRLSFVCLALFHLSGRPWAKGGEMTRDLAWWLTAPIGLAWPHQPYLPPPSSVTPTSLVCPNGEEEGSALVLGTGNRHWDSALVLGTGTRHWQSALVLGTGTQHWYSALVLGTGTQHWYSALVLGTGTRHWYSALGSGFGSQPWVFLLYVSYISP
jgi:hypothetical protein